MACSACSASTTRFCRHHGCCGGAGLNIGVLDDRRRGVASVPMARSPATPVVLRTQGPWPPFNVAPIVRNYGLEQNPASRPALTR